MPGVFRHVWRGHYAPKRKLALSAPPQVNREVTAQQGLIHLTGQNASVILGRNVTAQQGLIHVTGQNADVTRGRSVTAQQGLIHLTGQNAGVNASRVVTSQQGLIHVTGQNASVETTGAVNAQQGVIYITGQNATVNASRVVNAQQGVIHLTGQNVDISTGKVITATQGVIHLVGQNADVEVSRVVLSRQGVIHITGQDATVTGYADPETFYIDPVDGNDSNDGLSTSTPKKTWASLAPYVASNTYLQKAGTAETITSALAWTTAATSDRPIVVGRYGDGDDPIIQGTGAAPSALINFAGAAYWSVSDIVFQDNNSAGTSGAIVATSAASNNIVLNRITVQDVSRHGIRVNDGDDWTITNSTFGSTQRSHINFETSENLTLENNTYTNWNVSNTANQDAVFLNGGCLNYSISGETFTGSTTTDDVGALIDASGSVNGANTGTISSVIGTTPGVGISANAAGSTCTVSLCDLNCGAEGIFWKVDGTYVVQHCTVRSATIPYKLGFSGSDFAGSATLTKSVMYRSTSGVVMDANNISSPTLAQDYNLWFNATEPATFGYDSSTYAATAWPAVVGLDVNSVMDRDPLFSGVNGQLLPGSPADGAGGAKTLTEDYLGAAYSSPTDIGAYSTGPASTGGGRGAKGRRKRKAKYPRRISIDGVLHLVKSYQEEQRLLAAYREKLEREALELALEDAPAKEVAKAKVKVVRAQRREEESEERADEWLSRLREDDEIILAALFH